MGHTTLHLEFQCKSQSLFFDKTKSTVMLVALCHCTLWTQWCLCKLCKNANAGKQAHGSVSLCRGLTRHKPNYWTNDGIPKFTIHPEGNKDVVDKFYGIRPIVNEENVCVKKVKP